MIIAPSLLNAPYHHVSDTLKKLDHAKLIHLDIMDGHFVPNLSFGIHIVKEIKALTTIPLDIHLMTTHTLPWIEQFKEVDPLYITIHVEARDVSKAIERIKAYGIKVGLALKPQTPLDVILPYLKEIDLVLVMTVEPGFGGQSFMMSMLEKVKALKILQSKYSFLIEVDGGINDLTLGLAKEAGVDISVMGSFLFKQEDYSLWLKDL
jgi:ribulose-phosphate 3-epimerase